MRPLVGVKRPRSGAAAEDSKLGTMPRAISRGKPIIECGGELPDGERALTEVLGDGSCEHLVGPVHDGIE